MTSTYYKNENLQDAKVKNKILKYLHASDIKLNVKHKQILDKETLEQINDQDYVVCPRFSGTRSWIIFFHIHDHYYAVNFPKHSQHKRDSIVIHPVDLQVSKDIYAGTIMEGIYYRIYDQKFLIVDEVYTLSGENQLLKSKEDRLNILTDYFKRKVKMDNKFMMCVSQYYQINKMSLYELYEKIKHDNKIQKIIFYPKIYGGAIFDYTIMDSDLDDHIVEQTVFYMEKTKMSDVYNLLSTTNQNKIDIAYIPTMELSKKCKQWFKENKTKCLLVKCQLDNNKKKWVPLEIIEE